MADRMTQQVPRRMNIAPNHFFNFTQVEITIDYFYSW